MRCSETHLLQFVFLLLLTGQLVGCNVGFEKTQLSPSDVPEEDADFQDEDTVIAMDLDASDNDAPADVLDVLDTVETTDSEPDVVEPMLGFGDGRDGDLVVADGDNIDLSTTNTSPDRSCADGGDAVAYAVAGINADDVVTLTTAPAPGGLEAARGCLEPGDHALLIVLQGATSDVADVVGQWEVLEIATVMDTAVTFTTPLTNDYGMTVSGKGPVVALQRIPQYSSVTIPDSAWLTGAFFDCQTGGVLALQVAGTLTVGGAIRMNGRGFQGGAVGSEQDGYQGNSWATDCGASGSQGTTAATGGGGGGSHDACQCSQGAGGGGGHMEPGAPGQGTENGLPGGAGGGSYGASNLTERVFMGSGGGGGANHMNGPAGAGARGGGILLVAATSTSFVGNGRLVSNGQSGGHACNTAGGGGGGAGGSVLLETRDLTGSFNLNAAGGAGGTWGDTAECGNTGNNTHAGGNGGGGRTQLRLVD